MADPGGVREKIRVIQSLTVDPDSISVDTAVAASPLRKATTIISFAWIAAIVMWIPESVVSAPSQLSIECSTIGAGVDSDRSYLMATVAPEAALTRGYRSL